MIQQWRCLWNLLQPEEVLLVEVRQMSDGVAVRFAKVLRKIPVPGELVKQLSQLVPRIACIQSGTICWISFQVASRASVQSFEQVAELLLTGRES